MEGFYLNSDHNRYKEHRYRADIRGNIYIIKKDKMNPKPKGKVQNQPLRRDVSPSVQ